MIDWNELFSSASVEKQVNILNDPFFQYFFLNFIRTEVITFDDKDSL